MASRGKSSEDLGLLPNDELAAADESGMVPAGVSDYRLYREGKLEREELYERLAQRATAHLEGVVAAARLAEVRQLLVVRLANDETLTPLSERALGG